MPDTLQNSGLDAKGPIKPFKKGEADTLLETDRANQLVSVVNALATAEVAPTGKVLVAGGRAIIDLTALRDAIVKDLSDKVALLVQERLAAMRAEISLEIDQEITSQVPDLIAAEVPDLVDAQLSTVSVSLTCNPNGTATVSLGS